MVIGTNIMDPKFSSKPLVLFHGETHDLFVQEAVRATVPILGWRDTGWLPANFLSDMT